MITTTLRLRDELDADFARACAELTEARLLQARKDTPTSRAAVAQCRGRIDAVLDLYLEMGLHRR